MRKAEKVGLSAKSLRKASEIPGENSSNGSQQFARNATKDILGKGKFLPRYSA